MWDAVKDMGGVKGDGAFYFLVPVPVEEDRAIDVLARDWEVLVTPGRYVDDFECDTVPGDPHDSSTRVSCRRREGRRHVWLLSRASRCSFSSEVMLGLAILCGGSVLVVRSRLTTFVGSIAPSDSPESVRPRRPAAVAHLQSRENQCVAIVRRMESIARLAPVFEALIRASRGVVGFVPVG